MEVEERVDLVENVSRDCNKIDVVHEYLEEKMALLKEDVLLAQVEES